MSLLMAICEKRLAIQNAGSSASGHQLRQRKRRSVKDTGIINRRYRTPVAPSRQLSPPALFGGRHTRGLQQLSPPGSGSRGWLIRLGRVALFTQTAAVLAVLTREILRRLRRPARNVRIQEKRAKAEIREGKNDVQVAIHSNVMDPMVFLDELEITRALDEREP